MPQNLCEGKIHIQDVCESPGMQMLSTGIGLIIIFMCVESPVGLTLKSDKWKNFESSCLFSTNFIIVHSLHFFEIPS
jgi:hypothetical protein